MNKIFVVGRLGEDPVIRQAGDANVASFSVAENPTRRKNQNGDVPTNWYRCTAWRGLGETCAKYLHKGDQISLVGTLELRHYTGNDGQQRSSMEIQVSDVEFGNNRRQDTGATNEQVGTAATVPMDEDVLPF